MIQTQICNNYEFCKWPIKRKYFVAFCFILFLLHCLLACLFISVYWAMFEWCVCNVCFSVDHVKKQYAFTHSCTQMCFVCSSVWTTNGCFPKNDGLRACYWPKHVRQRVSLVLSLFLHFNIHRPIVVVLKPNGFERRC